MGRSATRLATLALLLAACTPATEAVPARTVTGVVIAVDGDLSEVTAFTVSAAGEEMTFTPSPSGDYEFPLPHLRDHLRDGAPVRVGYVEEGGALVAVSLADG